MARLLAFASLLLLATPNLAYPLSEFMSYDFQVSNDSNNPFEDNNLGCTKPGHQNSNQLLNQYHKFITQPKIDVHSPVINHLMEIALVLRNDSTELLPKFEKNYQMDSWKNFTHRKQWQFDVISCSSNLIVADEISMTLLAIRNGFIPALRPPYTHFDFLLPHSDKFGRLIVPLLKADEQTGKMVDKYFTTGEPSKKDVLNQLSEYQKIASTFKVEFQKAVGDVYNKLLEQKLVLWPEDAAWIQAFAQKTQFINNYIEDFKSKFTANLI